MRGRLEQILDGGGQTVRFANWDQDAAAVERAYWREEPDRLRGELVTAFDAAAEAFDRPTGREFAVIIGATAVFNLVFCLLPSPLVNQAGIAAAALLS